MLLYEFDPRTSKYLGMHEARLDEWQSKIKGEPSYMAEADCSFEEPPAQEGYTAYMVNGKWALKADPSLDEAKTAKVAELKAQRDAAEVEPIEYNGNKFDYDDKARERINAAIIALESTVSAITLIWTTADNQDVKVTASDLRGVIAQAALRSDKLHTAYRIAKKKIEDATTKEAVESVEL